MTVELGVARKGSWWIFWPALVAGLVGPLIAGHGLSFRERHRRLCDMFLLCHDRWQAVPSRFRVPVWLVAVLTGLATGLCLGVLTYYFPLK